MSIQLQISILLVAAALFVAACGDDGDQTTPIDTETASSTDSNSSTDSDSVANQFCTYPTQANSIDVQAAYDLWKETVITADGAGGFLRVGKPDSGTIIDSTVSEGIGYGMLLTVYGNDQEVFDNLWKYEQIHLNVRGLMDWEIDPNGKMIGAGAALDGDEDMAWALIMADKKWGVHRPGCRIPHMWGCPCTFSTILPAPLFASPRITVTLENPGPRNT